MKRSRLLRSSFIVVSAASVAAAAAIACGSSTDATGTGSAADGGGGGTDGSNAPGCPATAPKFQDPCSGTLTCSYDAGAIVNACGTFPNVTTAQCSDGKWGISGVGVSCNPPGVPPDAGMDAMAHDGGDGGDGG